MSREPPTMHRQLVMIGCMGSQHEGSGSPPGRIVLLAPGEGDRIGSIAALKAGRADGDGRITLIEYEAPPGFASPLHAHRDADEAWFILEGLVTYHGDAWSAEAGPGSFILVPRGTPHRYTVTGPTAARFLELFTVGGKEAFFRDVVARRARHAGHRLPYDEAKTVYDKYEIDLLEDAW